RRIVRSRKGRVDVIEIETAGVGVEAQFMNAGREIDVARGDVAPALPAARSGEVHRPRDVDAVDGEMQRLGAGHGRCNARGQVVRAGLRDIDVVGQPFAGIDPTDAVTAANVRGGGDIDGVIAVLTTGIADGHVQEPA